MQTTKVGAHEVSVRVETREDLPGIRSVEMGAYGRAAEANLVDVLRRHWEVILSLVAEVDGEVVGHALLTQVTLMPTVPGLRMVGLGPIAVRPEFQGRGIGSQLIREAIRQAGLEGWQAIVVLGDPSFYGRFGFVPASQYGVSCEFRVRQDSFLVLELRSGTLEGIQGTVRYQPEFSGF